MPNRIGKMTEDCVQMQMRNGTGVLFLEAGNDSGYAMANDIEEFFCTLHLLASRLLLLHF